MDPISPWEQLNVEREGHTSTSVSVHPVLNIGGHVSLEGKPAVVMTRLRDQGFTGLQTFASSPRMWRTPSTPPETFGELGDLATDHGISTVVLHAIYLINLASSDERIYEASVQSLIWTVQAAAALSSLGVVLHIGSHLGSGFDACRLRVVSALDRVLRATPPGPLLILENNAGSGGCIGADFGEMGVIMTDLGRPASLAVCLDTAHAFQLGYELRTVEGLDRLFESIDRGPGLQKLAMLHVNDSKTELGSRHDRHDNIGFGHIGQEGFANLMKRSEVHELPLILETPNLERRPADRQAILDAYENANAGRKENQVPVEVLV